MTYLRCTPAIEDIAQDEAETFQRIADTFAARGQIMRADVRLWPDGGAAPVAQ